MLHRLQRLAGLAVVLAGVALPAGGQTPYPILLIHGIVSDDRMWDGTVADLAGRFGITNPVSVTFHACLNLDGNPALNNQAIKDYTNASWPPFFDGQATTADIGLYFPASPTGMVPFVYRLNFDFAPNGDLYQGVSIPFPGVTVESTLTTGRTSLAVRLGSLRHNLHPGQYLRLMTIYPGGVASPVNGRVYYRIEDQVPANPAYDTVLSVAAGAPDPGFLATQADFRLESLSNQEAVTKQAVAIQSAIREILRRTGAPRVVVITHSMGGLAARVYLQTPSLWAASNNHGIAKLVTLGTPHLGSNAASEGYAAIAGIDTSSNASRDLAYDYNGSLIRSYPPNAVPADAVPGILLFGGPESGVPSGSYLSQDVDANGQVSSLTGLDFLGSPNFNTARPLPQDVDYSWLVGLWQPPGDLAVRSDRQYLANTGNTELLHACHSGAIPTCTCPEARAVDALLEALDEPNSPALAYDLPLGGSVEGFVSCRQNALTWSCVDDDVYRVAVGSSGVLSVTVSSGQGLTSITLLNAAGEALPGATASINGGAGATLSYPVGAAATGTYYVRLRGLGTPSQTGVDGSGTIISSVFPCNTHLLSTPYVVSARLQSSLVSLSASPQSLSVGQQTSLLATVRTSSGALAGAGIGVVFTANATGLYGGCTVTGSGGCRAVTDAGGVAQVTFSAANAGTISVTAQAETGGSAQTLVTFGARGGSATASPNPVAVNLPSTISVTYQPAPPAGTTVTFSSGYPGFFSGGSSPYSPSNATTDANGTATIKFTSGSVGTATLNIDSSNAATQAVALQINNPNASVGIQLTVSYVSGDASSSTYRVEGLVTDLGGQPLSGQRIDFNASAGSFCPPSTCSSAHDFTAVNGIGRANLTVTAAATVAVTATVNSSNATTTFVAQIGSGASGLMTPIHTFSLASGSGIFGVAFSPDGGSLVASSYGNSALVAWSTGDWSQRWSSTGQHGKLGEVSISSNSSQFMVASDRGSEFHAMSNGAWICDSSLSSPATFLATYAGGSSVFAASSSTTYRANSCSALGAGTAGAFERESHFDYSSARGYVAGGDANGSVDFWDSASGGLVKSIPIVNGGNNAYDASWTANGSRVVAVGKGGTVALINTSGSPTSWSKIFCGVPSMPGWRLTGAVWLDNDTKIAVGGDNNGGAGRIEVLDASSCASLRYAATDSRVLEMAWNPTTQDLAAGTGNGSVYIFKPLAPPDTIAPTISITTPNDGAVTNQASVPTSGRVTDNTSVSLFSINGSAIPIDADGNFASSVPLAEGQNTVAYHAVDPAGNAADVTRSVVRVVDRVPPVITGVAVSPSSGTPGTAFIISASVTDADTGVASATVTVHDSGGATVATIPLAHATGSSYSAAFDSTGKAPGGYSIDITAIDSSPQANSRTLGGAAAFTISSLPVPPAAPSSLQAAASAAWVDLLWIDNSANEDGFKMERRIGAADTWNVVATLPADTVAYRDSGVSCGTTYTYRVRAFNGAGESANSNEAVVFSACVSFDLYTLTPCRVFDSRSTGGQPLASGQTYAISVAGICGVPTTAKAVALNVTVTQSTAAGYLTLWPYDLARPATSVVNFSAGQTLANNALLLLSTDGLGRLGAAPSVAANGTVHVIIDINGYFQ